MRERNAVSLQRPIYLDGLASLPLAPEARSAMFDAWAAPGNPSSPHRAGELAARTVASARAAVADLVGATPNEIVFTSGATEANNLLLGGLARRALAAGDGRRRVVVSAIEHKAVLEPAKALAADGFEVVLVPAESSGRVDLTALRSTVDERTLLVSVMAANNETGVVQPVREIAAAGRASGALVHCDAAQAAGKIPIDVVDLDVDYLSLSAHKLYGPAGAGALFVSASAPRPVPLLIGGGQQQGQRAGTEPAALLAGFGAAATLARTRLAEDEAHGTALARRFASRLSELEVPFAFASKGAATLPGSLCLLLSGIPADDLVQIVSRDVSVSTGSACNHGQVASSHVLQAMGFSHDESGSVFRVFFHRYLTAGDADSAAVKIAEAAKRLAGRTGRSRQSGLVSAP